MTARQRPSLWNVCSPAARDNDAVLDRLSPARLVINATRLCKDARGLSADRRGGFPTAPAPRPPPRAIAWI